MELLRRTIVIFRPLASHQWQLVSPRRFAGHNKWSKIKHRKATADIGKSKLVAKLTSEIRAAVREGGADANHNLQLASVVSRAREMDIPKATIQAAISNAAAGHGGGEKVMVEARGRTGYGLMIETVTDNKLRTRQQIQRILVKNGGTLGEQGSVAYSFTPKGIIDVSRTGVLQSTEPMEVAIEVGAEDVTEEVTNEEHSIKFICDADEVTTVSENLRKMGLETDSASVEYIPLNTVDLSSKEMDEAVKLIDAVSNLDDVVSVFDNISDG